VALTRRSRPSTYPQAVRELYALQAFGIKLGLRNIRGLLRSIENPHRRFRSIHIAGTNGKGSTAALLAAVLTESGYRTGLTTSPHLVDFRERIRVDGREISAQSVLAWSRKLLPEVWRRRSTFFEAVTAMAFGWFAEEAVDVAVVETGLGGRLDATNVLRPSLSIITSIGLEHTAVLGPTLTRIASEKGGIIKPRRPCVSGVRSASAKSVLRRLARKRGSPWIDATTRRMRVGRRSLKSMEVAIEDPGSAWVELVVGLVGQHQAENARTALAAIEVLRATGMAIPQSAVERGFERVRELTEFHGRLWTLRERPRVIVDVAHNPSAMRSLARSLSDMKIRPRVTVIGVAADKDLGSIARNLGPAVGLVIAVAARTSRARPSTEVAEAFKRAGNRVLSFGSVAKGLRHAIRLAGTNGTVLVTGSHFVAGEAVASLERRRYLTISQ
jgi:dihydrofolate synthase/folylpolyglutamate synthase